MLHAHFTSHPEGKTIHQAALLSTAFEAFRLLYISTTYSGEAIFPQSLQHVPQPLANCGWLPTAQKVGALG